MSNPNGPSGSPDFTAPSKAYGQPPAGAGAFGHVSGQASTEISGPSSRLALRADYAPWGKRVIAMLIDHFPTYITLAVFYVGYVLFLLEFSATGDTGSLPRAGVLPMIIGTGMTIAALGWTIYNRWMVAGRTGQSWGKRVTKITLISEQTGQPIGPLNAFLRDLLHILDGFAYVGYLWPLWDDKRQTFADMLMRTIVVLAPPKPD
jgi:uncharacterized RDD family membrane protein YckC